MLGILWTEYVSKEDVIKIEALNSFILGNRKRKSKYMRHIMRIGKYDPHMTD